VYRLGSFLALFEKNMKLSDRSKKLPIVKTVIVFVLVFQLLSLYVVVLSPQEALAQIDIIDIGKPQFSFLQVFACNGLAIDLEICTNTLSATQNSNSKNIAIGTGSGTLFTNDTQVGDFRQLNDCDVENLEDNFVFCINQIQTSDNPSLANFANGDGNFNLSNKASLEQLANQQNDCDEAGSNDNFITCSNVAGGAILGLSQSNTALDSSVANQANEASLSQIANQEIDCDEADITFPPACENTSANTIDIMEQSNTASGSSTANQSNHASLTQLANQNNDCDNIISGDGTTPCTNESTNTIGQISQSNTASSIRNRTPFCSRYSFLRRVRGISATLVPSRPGSPGLNARSTPDPRSAFGFRSCGTRWWRSGAHVGGFNVAVPIRLLRLSSAGTSAGKEATN